MSCEAGRESVVHERTLRASLRLAALFLVVAVVLGLNLPERYPVHFNIAGQPTRYAEGPGMWMAARWVLWLVIGLLVAVPLTETFLIRATVRRKLREEGLLGTGRGPAPAG